MTLQHHNTTPHSVLARRVSFFFTLSIPFRILNESQTRLDDYFEFVESIHSLSDDVQGEVDLFYTFTTRNNG